ncbi:MAG: hypothetical protein WCH34_09165 [Bacteroidota bacterium]
MANTIVKPVMNMPVKPSHVLEMVAQQSNTIAALRTSPDHLIETATLDLHDEHCTTLRTKQEAMLRKGGAEDKTEQRDIAYKVVYTDRLSNMDTVETAAIATNDSELAKALIVRNGYSLPVPRAPRVRPDVWAKNKKNERGTIIGKSKGPGKNKRCTVGWGYSLDGGHTWIDLDSTPICTIEITGITSGARFIIRRRFTIGNKTPQDWVQSSPITVN